VIPLQSYAGERLQLERDSLDEMVDRRFGAIGAATFCGTRGTAIGGGATCGIGGGATGGMGGGAGLSAGCPSFGVCKLAKRPLDGTGVGIATGDR